LLERSITLYSAQRKGHREAAEKGYGGHVMRYAIISDIHSNIEALTRVLDSLSGQSVDEIVCCGDIVGYYTNPNECIKLLHERGIRSIMGNHDVASAGIRDLDCWSVAIRAIEWTRGQLTPENRTALAQLPETLVIDNRFLLFHGALHPEQHPEDLHLDNEEDVEKSMVALTRHPSGVRLSFFGHIHRQIVYRYLDGKLSRVEGPEVILDDDAHYMINPGSVGQPRDGDPRASYLIYDASEKRISFHRVTYDVISCRRKAGRHGLLPDSFLKSFTRRARRKVAKLLGVYRKSR
jgi:predicted phosphodiesterase